MKHLKATAALVAILAPLATFSPQATLAQERHGMGPRQAADAAAPQAAPAPAPQAERHGMGPGGQQYQGRGDGGRYNGGGGRFGGGQQGGAPVQAQPQFQNRQDRGQGGFNNQGGRYSYRQQGAPNQSPQAQVQAQPQFQNRQDRQGGYNNRAGGDYRNRGGVQGFAPDVNGGRAYDRNGAYNNGGAFNRGDNRFRGDNGYRGENRYQGDNRYRGGDNYNRGGQRFAYRGREFYRFRSDPYIWPRGYASRSWGVRQILPSFFLMDRYYIDNFWDYGFDEPPYGYRWIRVGDDALLVNVYTGQIADVVPGVFYY